MTIAPSDMLLFAAVVREGGFTRAARALGLTKQTVSARIAKLEEGLGVRLLERTTRQVRVTDGGAGYAERCAAIALDIEQANDEVQQRQAEPVGLLRVSAPVLYGRRFLAPVLSRYLGRYPRVQVEIALSDRRVDLIEEGIDLAVRIGALDDSSLTMRKLDEGHVYYLASPRFLKTYGVPTPSALRSLRCIGARPHETWQVGTVSAKIEPVLVVNDLEVACAAAVDGVGLARLPSLVCGQEVRAGRLVVLFPGEAPQSRPVYAVYPSRRQLPTKVRAFIDCLSELVEPMKPLEPPRKRSGRAR